ncbi:hypothetical protein [Ectothiorhodospira sp. PHS-1]|nr:hypothetical protein [Ectothiorhodospira sp. PHS-1]
MPVLFAVGAARRRPRIKVALCNGIVILLATAMLALFWILVPAAAGI